MEEQLQTLNKLGYNIVAIINPIDNKIEYYLFDQFIPVDSIGQVQTFKHKIKGRCITTFLHDRASTLHLRISQIEEGTIRSNINALPIVSREYSSHFFWINYLSF